jgi:uncharacterized protein DUF4352
MNLLKRFAISFFSLLVIACGPTPVANQPGQPAPTTAAPAASSTAAPTATSRRTYKVGEAIASTDGWRLTVVKSEDSQPVSSFFTPKPGNGYVAVFVRHDNGSSKPVSTNPFFFKLQDSAGIRHDAAIFGSRDDKLGSGEVAPGAFVVGSIVFEVPTGDTKLSLIYEQFGYARTTIELF